MKSIYDGEGGGFMNEREYDELLNIKTAGDQKGFHASFHYHRYEPTSYHDLEILFKKYELKKSDSIVDFGCGKGRLNFYIHYLFHATVIGVEMNEEFYQDAVENKRNYIRKHKNSGNQIQFQCCLAEEYQINPSDNRFYFFNPFSIQIFMKIIKNILISVEESVRDVELVLYYPSEDYIYFLDNHSVFELKQEVTLTGYNHNPQERFLIYRLGM